MTVHTFPEVRGRMPGFSFHVQQAFKLFSLKYKFSPSGSSDPKGQPDATMTTTTTIANH